MKIFRTKIQNKLFKKKMKYLLQNKKNWQFIINKMILKKFNYIYQY